MSTRRQIDYERDQAIAEIQGINQARVSAFEQYVYRTLGTAELAARHANFLYQHGVIRGSLGTTRDPVFDTAMFTGVAIKAGGRYQVLAGSRHLDLKSIASLSNIIRSSNQATIVGPAVSTGAGDAQVPLLQPLNVQRGDFVVVFLDYRRFTDFAQDIHLKEKELISLIGLDGVTRARRTGRQLSTGEHVGGLVMQRQLASPNGSYVGPSVLDGIPRFFTHRRLPKYRLFVTSGIPVSAVENTLAERRFTTLATMFASMAAIVFVAILLILLVARRDRRFWQVVEANERLNEAQRLGKMGDWNYYAAENRFTFSRNLGQMYGVFNGSRKAGLGALGRYISIRELRRVEENIRVVIETGEPLKWELEVGTGAKDIRVHRVVATPIHDDKGRTIGVHGADQDITNEVIVRTLERRVADLARLDSMKAMTATIAHELNHPLAIISNYIAASLRLMRSEKLAAQAVEYLRASQTQIDHLAAIISSARDLVAPSAGPGEIGSLADVIKDVLIMLKAGPRGNELQFIADIPVEADRIIANLAQLKQVLFNLSRNSVDATKSEVQPQLELTVSVTAKEHRFELRDNGAGMSELSDPFAALATSKSSGLGLGLSISRTIVEAHGGKIWIERTGEDGTSVVFTIRGGCSLGSEPAQKHCSSERS